MPHDSLGFPSSSDHLFHSSVRKFWVATEAKVKLCVNFRLERAVTVNLSEKVTKFISDSVLIFLNTDMNKT